MRKMCILPSYPEEYESVGRNRHGNHSHKNAARIELIIRTTPTKLVPIKMGNVEQLSEKNDFL